MNKTTLSIVAISMLALLAIGSVAAFGFGNGGLNTDLSEEELAEMQEHRDAMHTAIENKDFTAWQELMQERVTKMQGEITEENFNKHVERHANREEFKAAAQELKDSGEFSREDIQALKEQYGVEGRGFKRGRMRGMKQGNCPFAE